MDTKIDIGVKYADKQARHFDNEKIKAGQCVIGLQVTACWFRAPLDKQKSVITEGELFLYILTLVLSYPAYTSTYPCL